MTSRSVQDWFLFMQDNNDDQLVERLLNDLVSITAYWRREDEQLVLNMITAVRLDQMTKENS